MNNPSFTKAFTIKDVGDFMRSVFYFDQLGENFEAYMSNYDVERRKSLIFNHLLGHIPVAEKQVLEVGCGTGRFSREIRARGGDLTVLDIGATLVKTVTSAVDCRGVTGDATKLPFHECAFDMIISSECIEHTHHPDLAIREMCRVCRPGGFVCFTTPNRLWYPLIWLADRFGLRKFSGIENWIFPHHAAHVLARGNMRLIQLSGCHLWPFQVKPTRPLLCRLDHYGHMLYPWMINFGAVAQKSPGGTFV